MQPFSGIFPVPRHLFWSLVAMAWLAGASAVLAADGGQSTGETFDIFEFRVLGSSAVPQVDIERAVYPLLGPGKTIKDVEQASEAIAAVYRDSGFGAVAVDIPEQDVAGGVVRLQVTEGRLGEVRVSGARYFSNGQILASMGSLRAGEVLNLKDLQTDLAAVNRRTADRSVTPVLRAGKTPGTVDVELKVKDELPLTAQFEVNDRYTADTSHTRVNATLGFNNLFQRFHSLALQYQTAPEEPQEARVLAATYLAPVGDQGRVLAAFVVDTDSDVATIGALNVLGAGRIYGLRYVMPLAGGDGFYPGFTAGVDYKDFDENIVLEDGSDEAPITYVNWSLAYNSTWQRERSTTAFNLGANFGLRGVVNDADEFAYKRYNARPNYIYLRGGLRYDRAELPIPGRLFMRIDGQATFEPLISNEQFAIGGAESVRGYLEAEQLGDNGLSGSLEWRTPVLAKDWGGWMQGSYALVFADAGIVGILDALPEQSSGTELASAGVGVRLLPWRGFDAELDWAYPFLAGDRTPEGDSRVHFRVRYDF